MLSRRAFLIGSIAAAAAAGVPAALAAARYRNVSGLRAGSFVWNPRSAGEGPLTILVSLAEEMVHVYRGQAVVGFSTIVTSRTRSDLDGSVLRLSGRPASGAPGFSWQWRGSELIPGTPLAAASPPVASIPEDFARLLAGLDTAGAVVIVARERSAARVVEVPGPFGREIETGSVAAGNVARFAAPELSRAIEQAQVRHRVSAVLVSHADSMAYQLHEGRVVDATPVVIEDAARPLGRHAYVLLGVQAGANAGARNARWLAVGLGNGAEATEVSEDMAATALARVRFVDRHGSAALASAMRRGTALILSDGAGPQPGAVARSELQVLAAVTSGETAASPTLSPDASQAPQVAARPVEVPSSRSEPRPRRTKSTKRREPRKVAEERPPHETWAAKFFRSY